MYCVNMIISCIDSSPVLYLFLSYVLRNQFCWVLELKEMFWLKITSTFSVFP